MILWLLFSIPTSLVMAGIVIIMPDERINLRKFIIIQTTVIFVFFAILFYYSDIDKANHKLIEQQQEIVWINNKCPVYKSSCGSYKHPYSCEKKAAVIGRNKVGDIFVEAYPIC